MVVLKQIKQIGTTQWLVVESGDFSFEMVLPPTATKQEDAIAAILSETEKRKGHAVVKSLAVLVGVDLGDKVEVFKANNPVIAYPEP